MTYSLKIVLTDNTEFDTPDKFNTVDDAINQMHQYGTQGYYSRARLTYYPPTMIKQIRLEQI